MLVGSLYFFKDIANFIPKDVDTLLLIDNPIDFKYNYQLYNQYQILLDLLL